LHIKAAFLFRKAAFFVSLPFLYETPSKKLQLLEFDFSLWLVVTAMYVFI